MKLIMGTWFVGAVVLLALSIFAGVTAGFGELNGPKFSPTDGLFSAGLMLFAAGVGLWDRWEYKRLAREHGFESTR